MVITHLVDDGKAGQLVTSSAQLRTARLEALLDADTDAGHGGTAWLQTSSRPFMALPFAKKSSKISTRSPEFRNFLARVMSYSRP
mgnify:CR=1 FL=1